METPMQWWMGFTWSLIVCQVVVRLASAIRPPFTRRRLLAMSAAVTGCLLCGQVILDTLHHPHGVENVDTSSPRVWLCLDVSRSMLARDVAPDRLNRAKQILQEMAGQLDAEFAVLAFAGETRQFCPMTADRQAVVTTLAELGVDSVTQGGSRLQSLADFFARRPKPADHKEFVVLVSDGGHEEFTPAQNGFAGRPVTAIGMGDSLAGSTIPVPPDGRLLIRSGQPVVTRLREDTLMALADANKGIYLPGTDVGVDRSLLQKIERDKTTSEESSPLVAGQPGQWMLLLAFSLFVFENILLVTRPTAGIGLAHR